MLQTLQVTNYKLTCKLNIYLITTKNLEAHKTPSNNIF